MASIRLSDNIEIVCLGRQPDLLGLGLVGRLVYTGRPRGNAGVVVYFRVVKSTTDYTFGIVAEWVRLERWLALATSASTKQEEPGRSTLSLTLYF